MMCRAGLAVLATAFLLTGSIPAWGQLTGTYTIDSGGGGDYLSIVEAADDLNINGVGAGGVTFLVNAGTYTGEVTVTAVGTAADPIIFKPNGAVSVTVGGCPESR